MTLRLKRTTPLVALAAALALAGCVGDGDDPITSVPSTAQGGTLFQRYVALGNSITAGFQSGGIVDSLQIRAYPVLLAQRAGATQFYVPLLNKPGCPAPFTAPLVAPTGTPPCALRDTTGSGSARFVGNVAVPGARIRDLVILDSTQSFAPLYNFITGGRTQIQAMHAADPTFVSVWIGNNDALAAALGGNLGPAAAGLDSTLTRLSSFQASLNAVVAEVAAEAPQGVMLVGVVDAVIAAPLIQPGAYFFLARDPATGRYNGKPVNANCSPVTALGAPNPLAANMVSFQIVANANFPEINCDPAAYPVGDPRRGALLLDTQEQAIVRTRIAQYNAAIQAAATANNWIYVDPNTVLGPYLLEKDANGRYQRARKCQDLATAATAAAFQAAVLNSCPVTGPTAAPNFFGSLISFDGVHPSSEAHRILAGNFAARINTRYGTTLSTATN
jgi:hypothetical protein